MLRIQLIPLILFMLLPDWLILRETVQGTAFWSIKPTELPYQVIDGGNGLEGYRIFLPAGSSTEEGTVVVMLHGYGGYNPMYYGGWIDHLVRNGNPVIFPYYQENMVKPGTAAFAGHAAEAVKAALGELARVRPGFEPLSLAWVGHSFGAVVATELASDSVRFGFPAPAAVFLCMPGTGPFTRHRLPDPSRLPEDCILGIVTGEGDRVVGDAFGKYAFTGAIRSARKFWMVLEDREGDPDLKGWHNEPCSRFPALDNGVRNYNFARTLVVGGIDAHDREAFWKTFDWMIEVSEYPDTWKHPADVEGLGDLGYDREGNPYGRVRFVGRG